MSDAVMVPISIGELIDKITILRIKSKRIADSAKLANVVKELEMLTEVLAPISSAHADLEPLTQGLTRVNESLWEIEDAIREHEHAKNFGPSFVELARSVYINNDERAALKKRINLLTGSALVEEKSYRDYTEPATKHGS